MQQAKAADFEFDESAKQRIDAEAQRLIDEHLTPGLAIGVMRDGRLVYTKGFGLADVDAGTKVTPDTVFLIGSITKHFTAASIVLLSEQGKLAIDDPIVKYLPQFPRGDEVTIRQLLTHTSGLVQIMGPGGALTPEKASAARSTDEMVSLIAGLPNLYAHEPGAKFLYSNAGYWLLGAIVEKASGEPLGKFFQKNLFERAGMTSTDLESDAADLPNLASGYLLTPDGDSFSNADRRRMNVAGGAGGIRSTVGDILRWQDALLAGRIVSPEGVKMMTTPEGNNATDDSPVPAASRGYGFGLAVAAENGHASVGHTGGSSQGFSASLKAFPDDGVAFIVLTNVGPSQRGMDGARRRVQRPGPPDQQPSRVEDNRREPRRVRPAAAIERVISELVAGPPKANSSATP